MKPKNNRNRNSNYKYKTELEKKRQGEGEAASKRRFRTGRKLPLSILLSLTLPLTVAFFGPFEIYCGSIEDFAFSLGDFFPLCIVAAVALSAVLLAVFLALDGKAYITASAVVLWLSVMAFLQRYYLNAGIDALTGDGVGNTEVSPITTVLNALLWSAVGAIVVFAVIFAVKN